MAEKEVVVRGIQWDSVLSIGQVTRAFRLAVWPPSKLFLCLLALVVTVGLAVLLDQAFETKVFGSGFADNMKIVFTIATSECSAPDWLPLPGNWYGPVVAVQGLFGLVCLYWQEYFWFALINTVVAILTWSFFGGAVCRMAAVQFARDERIGMVSALKFVCQRYASLVASPLAMFIVIVLIALPVSLIAGAVLLIPAAGELAFGAAFFLLLILGVVLALLALFGISGLGLQMPAIASEGRDAFDAISRSVSYVFNRPWRYIFYTVFSLLYLCVTFLLVRFFAFLTLKIPYAFLSLWPWIGKASDDGTPSKLSQVWTEPTFGNLFQMPQSEGTQHVAAWFICIYACILLGMMISFIPAFLLSSQTVIYFLLRRTVDFKDFNEVYIEEEQQKESGLARLEKMEETKVEPEPAVEPEPPTAQLADEEPKKDQADT